MFLKESGGLIDFLSHTSDDQYFLGHTKTQRKYPCVEITLVLGNVTGDSSFPSGQMDARRQIPLHKSSTLLLMATRHVIYRTSVRCHPCILYPLSWFAKAGHVHVTNPSMWYLLSMCVLSLPEANEISCWSPQISCRSHKLSRQDSTIFWRGGNYKHVLKVLMSQVWE